MPRYSPAARRLIAARMRDFTVDRMRSRAGALVTSTPQALAIALQEARAKRLHVPPRKKGSSMPRIGQFKKGGGRVGDGRTHKHHARGRRSTSKALTIVEKPTVKVIRVPTAARLPAKRSHGGVARKHHRNPSTYVERAHGAGQFIPGPFRLRSIAVSGLYGYIEGGKGLDSVKALLDKLPAVGKVPREFLLGAAANYFADRGDWIDAAAQALLDIAGYKAGQAGFALSGDDDDY